MIIAHDTRRLRCCAEALAEMEVTGRYLPTTRLHLVQDILCEVYRIQGATDPEGMTGSFFRRVEEKAP